MLGSNVSTVGGFSTAFKMGDKWQCDCIQIYLTLSRRWNTPILSKEKIKLFKEDWSKSSIKSIIGHIPFLVNLASPNKDVCHKSKKRFLTEIDYADKLNIPFLVLHSGSHCNSIKDEGIKRLIEGLNLIKEINNPSTIILLEIMSGQGSSIGSNLEEIKFILDRLERSDSFGVCLDTAHAFQSGYNIKGYKGYNWFMNEFDKIIGLDKLKVIHLNDSKTELGSKVDRHSIIGEGKIGLEFFHALLRDNRFINIPKILEIPERNEKSNESLIFLRKLMKLDHIEKRKR